MTMVMTMMMMLRDDNDASVGIRQVHRPHESHPLTMCSALYHDDDK